MGEELRRQAIYVVLCGAGWNADLYRVPVRVDLRCGGGDRGVSRYDHHHRLFSIFNEEISLTVIAALLTLVGYSMNDTIVVFDRIRENLKLSKRQGFEELVNTSINQTLSRTILTSGLTFLTALSLLLLAVRCCTGSRCAGGRYYRWYLFVGFHRQSDCVVLARIGLKRGSEYGVALRLPAAAARQGSGEE